MSGNHLHRESKKSYAGWAQAVFIPVKQHVVCCGLVPPLVGALGGAGVVQELETLPAQLAMGAVTTPLVTFGVMWLEQKWQDYKQQRAQNSQSSQEHVKECAAAMRDNIGPVCSHRVLTRKNFMKQTALGYAIYGAVQLLWPSHDHAQCDAPHHHSIHYNHHHDKEIKHVIPFNQSNFS